MLIVNASQILTLAGDHALRKGRAMRDLGILPRGYAVYIEGSKIRDLGKPLELKRRFKIKSSGELDAKGGVVLPGFVDSHTHAAFAAPRLQDFAMRTSGATYEEIAAQGGGIQRSVRDLRAASQKQLIENLLYWCEKALELGTTVMEVKSGYGLSLKEEKKILSAVAGAKKKTALELIATFLGAHAIAPEHKDNRAVYLKEVEKMAKEFKNLAEFCDVFCDRGYFSKEEAKAVLEAGKESGFLPKIHAEQLSNTGAAGMAASLGAVSVDHLDFAKEEDIRALSKSETVCSLVPGSNFFLAKPYPPARALIDGGCAVALASDFNPGTCPTLSMPLIISIAVMQMKMTTEEAISAATINGACALNLGNRVGSLEAGKQADAVITEFKDYREIPYYFGVNPVKTVIKKGKVVYAG